jgi:hypothetical protein
MEVRYKVVIEMVAPSLFWSNEPRSTLNYPAMRMSFGT